MRNVDSSAALAVASGSSIDLVPSVVAARPGDVWDITDFGAIGDGETVCTQAIAEAIDACAEAGGADANTAASTGSIL